MIKKKFLFSIMPPAVGHLHPLLPIAKALKQAGHEVLFACAPSFRETITAAGFESYSMGLDMEQLFTAASAVAQRMTAPPPPQAPAQAGVGGMQQQFPKLMVGAVEQGVPDLIALFGKWQPDVIVRSRFEYSGYLAAEMYGIPHVTSGVGLWLGSGLTNFSRWQGIEEALNQARVKLNLASDPGLASLNRYLYLDFAPPSFEYSSAQREVPTLHFIRPEIEDTTTTTTSSAPDAATQQSPQELSPSPLPSWVSTLAKQPTIYITLGTVFNQNRTIFEKILTGLHDEAYNLIVTVGRNNDPAALGPQPANVHIERYIPMSLILPYCDVVVAHGGFNSTMTALSAGLPQLFIPISADQPQNAKRCAEIGVGITLEPSELRPEDVRTGVARLLGEASYKEQAQLLQAEIKSLPGPEYAVELLLGLAETTKSSH
jgi:UDP:flavonoid glycosyltransferase YjiC (YdhE family)